MDINNGGDSVLTIDVNVDPAFYKPINTDPDKEKMRHEVLNIHLNGIAPLSHIYHQMDCAGISRMVLLAKDYFAVKGTTVVSNEEVKTLVDLAPDKFIGFASVDPNDADAESKLTHAFKDLGLKGLVLYPSSQHVYPDQDACKKLFALCVEYDKPVIVDSGLSWEPGSLMKFSRPILFEEIAAENPTLRICLTQFGWPWVQETAALLEKYRNLYADTGALYFDNAREFYTTTFTKQIPITWIDRSLRHQVMFGSANPRFEQIRMAHALDDLGLRASTLELIRSQNAEEFIGEKPLSKK